MSMVIGSLRREWHLFWYLFAVFEVQDGRCLTTLECHKEPHKGRATLAAEENPPEGAPGQVFGRAGRKNHQH
eukprot:992116-Pyramimonas_sp.AAC.1